MKFSITVLSGFLAALSVAAASDEPEFNSTDISSLEQNILFPDEAIDGQTPIGVDHEVLVTEINGQKVLFLVNSTVAEAAVQNSGIDLDDMQNSIQSEGANAKRDASAEAKWHWLSYRLFQPNTKRDANADADAKWHWLSYRLFQPNTKRDANADADAKWYRIHYTLFKPNV